MSLSDRYRALATCLLLTVGLTLSGCTLTPVYGQPGAASAIHLTYAEPSTRLEQVFYRHVSAGLGMTGAGEAGQLAATVRVSSTRAGLSAVSSPVNDYQIVATVTYTVTRNGSVIARGSRTSASGYQTTGQIVGNDAARSAAEEQAVRAAAEQVRLALIAELSPR